MIWVILLVLAALVGAYLLHPFWAERDDAANALLVEAKAQKAAIEEDEARGRLTADVAKQAKDALDRRILSILDAAPTGPDRAANALKSTALYAVPAILLLGGVGIYTQIGAPNYQPVTVAEFQAARMAELPQSLDQLVVVLSERLETHRDRLADLGLLLSVH
ncbi:MAG: c-type cytochrome biogenesis protein CcmI, partial [Pseudomonadota bacterium]